MNTFEQDIKDLTEATLDRVQQAIDSKETATFFLGRKSCSYCLIFAPKIASVATKTNIPVYFINSEKRGQEKQLAEFRSAYNIPTVPSLIQITEGQIKVRCDSAMSETEIENFIQF